MMLPFTVFAIAVAGTLGNGLHQAMVAIGVLMSPAASSGSPAPSRSACASTQYVEAAELMGASPAGGSCASTSGPRCCPTIAVTDRAGHRLGAAGRRVADLPRPRRHPAGADLGRHARQPTSAYLDPAAVGAALPRRS